MYLTPGKQLKRSLYLVMFSALLLTILLSYCSPKTKDYFILRDGLRNAQIVFENTGKGRVVFLGGSITHMKGWRDMVCDSLKKRFPNTEFDFIDAGIPSTGSTPGAFRLQRDVFSYGKVDLLFEEAAVNDDTNGRTDLEQIRGMEGIIRHARKINPAIDIIMMHFVDPGKMESYNKGEIPTVIQNHEIIADHYKIPSINLALEVTERINRGEFTWEKDFVNLHPAPFGHRLYASTINRLFDAAWSKTVSKTAHVKSYPLPKKYDAFSYESGYLLDIAKVTHKKGFYLDQNWQNRIGGKTRPGFVDVPMLIGEKPGDSFSVEFSGSAVGLFVAAGPDAGIIEFSIDDKTWEKLDLFTQWSHHLHIPWLYMLATELTYKPHILQVRLSAEKNSKSVGTTCRIVHIAVNGMNDIINSQSNGGFRK